MNRSNIVVFLFTVYYFVVSKLALLLALGDRD